MKLLKKSEMPADYDLVVFGDNQAGNTLSHVDGYQDCLDFIMSAPRTIPRYAVHMGDLCEGYFIDDPRYSPEILKASPNECYEDQGRLLLPLVRKQRLLTILLGNQDFKLLRTWGNPIRDLCEQLREKAGSKAKWPQYGAFACKIEFADKHGLQFKGYFTHGKKPIGSVAEDPITQLANMHRQLKRLLYKKAGDALLMGRAHTHKLLVAAPQPLLYMTTTKDGKLKQRYTQPLSADYIGPELRFYASTGSFLKGQGEGDLVSYVEAADYDPVELGFIVAEVRDRKLQNVRKVVL